MGSFMKLFGVVVVLMFTYAGGYGTVAYCDEEPTGKGYNTPEECLSECPNLCTNMTVCYNVSNPCDPNYPYDPHHPCDTCDPCRKCLDLDSFYLCDEIINFPPMNINCDPCKRCSRNETEFCLSMVGTPPPPPPVDPTPSFNHCYNPFSGGECRLVDNLACFCTYDCN